MTAEETKLTDAWASALKDVPAYDKNSTYTEDEWHTLHMGMHLTHGATLETLEADKKAAELRLKEADDKIKALEGGEAPKAEAPVEKPATEEKKPEEAAAAAPAEKAT